MPSKKRKRNPVFVRGNPAPGIALHETCLEEAARVEFALSSLYITVADLETEPARRSRWQQAARFARHVGQTLGGMTPASPKNGSVSPRRNGKVTPCREELRRLYEQVESVRAALETGNGRGAPNPLVATGKLAGRECAELLLPLAKLLKTDTSRKRAFIWRAVRHRQRVLRKLDAAVPELPQLRSEIARPRPGVAKGAAHPRRRKDPRQQRAAARVEQLNALHQCGRVRTEDGRRAFFCAQAVQCEFARLKVGDPVNVTLRRGPLGLAAVALEHAGDTPPPAA